MQKKQGLSNRLLYVAVLTFLVSTFMLLIQTDDITSPKSRAILGKAYQEGDSFVNRTFMTHPVRVNQTFYVNLSVRNLNTDYIYAIEEHVPSGFTILDDDGSSYSDASQLKWVYYSNTTPAPNADHVYQLRAPATQGDYTFTGSYQFESTPSNISDSIVGDIIYTVLPPDYYPTVTLSSPSASYVTFTNAVTFVCSATDDTSIVNISLYTNYFGAWSEMTSSASDTITYPVSGLSDSYFSWNCLACDNSGQCAYSALNRTIRIVTRPVELNESGYIQTNPNPTVNGPPITIEMPVVRYYTVGTHTVSVTHPALWTDTSNFRVIEGGSTTKTVTRSGNNLTWSADLTRSAVMRFDIPSPQLANEVEFANASRYNKTFQILDNNHLTNIQASINVIDGYSGWRVYQYVTGVWPDRTGAYGLIVSGGVASFSGFNTSNVTFRITGVNTTSTTTGLDIWDSSDSGTYYPNEQLTFYARYYDLNTSVNLTNAVAQCNITFLDIAANMNFNSSLNTFTYSRSFTTSGDFTYDVWCTGTGYDPLTLDDIATITPLPFCGDGTCNGNETCSTCSGDCGSCPPANTGGGGGGGGGSRDTGTDELEKEFKFDHDFYSIKARALSRALIINAVELTSVDVPTPKPAYKYFQLTATDGFVNAQLRFRVDKSWFVKENMNKLTTTLMRYNGNDWEIMLTQKEMEDYDYIYFLASATQFSQFAVVADANPYEPPPVIPDPKPEPEVEVPDPKDGDGTEMGSGDTGDGEDTDEDDDLEEKGKSLFKNIWAYLAFASAMFIVIFFVIFSINKQKQMQFTKVSNDMEKDLRRQEQARQVKAQPQERPHITQKEEQKIEKEAVSLSKEARQLDQRLEGYVRECKQKGFNSEQVRKSLLEAGWNVEDIDQALTNSYTKQP